MQKLAGKQLFLVLSALLLGGGAFYFTWIPYNASAAPNLIANPSLENEGVSGNPASWHRGRWGTNNAAFSYPVAGIEGARAAQVTLSSHSSGDAKWYFERISTQGGKTYRFSNRYKASVETFVTVEWRMSDGSFRYVDVARPTASSSWGKTQVTFTAPSGAQELTVFHLINKTGTLAVDDYLLEETGNVVPNASFETAGTGGDPEGWKRGGWGSNTRAYGYPVAGIHGTRAARVSITSHSSGDAKWYFEPIPVKGGDFYTYSNQYHANVPSFIVAEYRMADDSFLYDDIALASPSSSWTSIQKSFKVPSGAVSLTVYHLIAQTGSLTIDNVGLQKMSSAPGPAQGVVTLSFDDGWKSIYENAIPILEQAGLKSSQYIVTGRFGFPAYMTKNQVLDMHAKGHEIGSHTRTHRDLTTLSQAEAREEIFGSRQDLVNLGIEPVNTFAYPFGAYSLSVQSLVQEAGYIAARSSNGGVNAAGAIDQYALRRRSVENSTTFAQVKQSIDSAVANKEWLVLLFHSIDHSASPSSSTPEMLSQIVDYLVSQNVRVTTLRDGYSIFSQ